MKNSETGGIATAGDIYIYIYIYMTGIEKLM